MGTEQRLEWIQSMRLSILGSLFELSKKNLQTASWMNPTNANPHYSLVAFVESSLLRDEDLLSHHRTTGVIDEVEYTILRRATEALRAYSPAQDHWYNHEAVLDDPRWTGLTELLLQVFTTCWLCPSIRLRG